MRLIYSQTQIFKELQRYRDEKKSLNKQPSTGKLSYLDSTQPITKRIEDLFGKMTLEEKISQLKAR